MEKGTSRTSSITLAVEGIILLIGISLFGQNTNLENPDPMIPSAVVPRNTYKTNIFHFAATCYSTNAESIFSPECVWTNIVTNNRTGPVTLAWDPSKDTNVIGYRLYEGTIAFQYPTNWDAGNHTNITVNTYPPPPPLNRYVRVSWKGTNIWGSYDLTRPWMLLSYATNSFTLTNPTGVNVYWKATNIVITNWAAP